MLAFKMRSGITQYNDEDSIPFYTTQRISDLSTELHLSHSLRD